MMRALFLTIAIAACTNSDSTPAPDAALELDAELQVDANPPDATGAPADAELPANDCRVVCGTVGYYCAPEGWRCNVASQPIACELPDPCPAL